MDLAKSSIGIEFGSTRIKAVLIDEYAKIIATGSFEWENELRNDVWTYNLDSAINGMQLCFSQIKKKIEMRYGKKLKIVGSIGISGMMHGYLVFSSDDRQLCEFRTWRNTITKEASEKLSSLFSFNIPQRWSISHLYQAILNNEKYIYEIDWMTTLSGYIHYRLTGQKTMGIGEASGMFPVDGKLGVFDEKFINMFDELVSGSLSKSISAILPVPLKAGVQAGILTKEGASLLDPEGDLEPGIPLAPCEGDAGTGMVATNTVRKGTGNISVGTSIFSMIVTDSTIGVNRVIDVVTTPAGLNVAMIHCNNCTSDIDAWINIFIEYCEIIGISTNRNTIYEKLFSHAMSGSSDCGGLTNFNYVSGEEIIGLNAGRPLFIRNPDANFTLSNFIRTLISSSFATLRIGLESLKESGIEIERLIGHGGLFKTKGVANRILSAAVGVPVFTMEMSGEGGPFGMAILAQYMIARKDGELLEDFLDKYIFSEAMFDEVIASPEELEGFNIFFERFIRDLPIETTAIQKI